MTEPEGRPVPTKAKRPPAFGPLVMMLVFAVVAGALTYALRGLESTFDAVEGAAFLLLRVVPIMAAGVLIAGFAHVLLPREKIAGWLGRESGLRGLALSTVAGALTPGGPMASYPLVMVLIAAGADRGAVVAFITAWGVLGLQRIVTWEFAIFGAEFAFIRFIASAALPLIAGMIARRLPIKLETQAGSL